MLMLKNHVSESITLTSARTPCNMRGVVFTDFTTNEVSPTDP
jgi:hypothetical protein